jgi:tetratricopeptide (TPR) repeat protein
MKDCSEISPTPPEEARRHRSGCAWTDRGTQHLAAGGDWESSVRCHHRAVELLGELPLDGDPAYLADLGAAWVNLGCALQVGPTRASLGEALDAFDRAVELLSGLPFQSNSRFRHNLAAAWMNRADAFALVDTETSRSRALQAYARAIEVAGELPLDEKPSFRILLGSCWINLGNLHQRLSRIPEAVHAYEGAVAALGGLPASGHRLACHHAATAWANRGEALLSSTTSEACREAVESARMALAQVEGRDLEAPVDAKLSLRALRVLARGLEFLARGSAISTERAGILTDVAERGLGLAFCGRRRDPAFFDPFVVWFFSFGSRIYGRYQPQFLSEYIAEALGRFDSGAGCEMAAELRAIARMAAGGALEGLGRSRLLVEGTPQTTLLLNTVRELRAIESQS